MHIPHNLTFIRLSGVALILLTLAAFNLVLRTADATDSKSAYAAVAPADCNLEFGHLIQYDNGEQTSVAVNASGLVLEFHKSQNNAGIWYHFGKVEGASVTWGRSQHAGADGYWPAVAISKEGYVIAVHSNKRQKSGADLYYQVGKIDPNGDQNQSITWLTGFIHWDRGFHASIAMNDNGVIVGVHETHGSSDSVYYRVGHLRNPAGGDYTVDWDSGSWGMEYESGWNPRIAINNHNQIVEVHRVPGETLLHYRRGTVSGGIITFGDSRRYENYATDPSVALLDSGLVLEVHNDYSTGLVSKTGSLSLSNGHDIEWPASKLIDGHTFIYSPAVATNGVYAIETHGVDVDNSLSLRSSVARVCTGRTQSNLG
jgi:hypothetical protein